MLKKIFDILFSKRNQELTHELKKNPSFRNNEEMSSSSKNTNYEKTLNKGEKFSVTAPDLGKNKDVTITSWLKKQMKLSNLEKLFVKQKMIKLSWNQKAS